MAARDSFISWRAPANSPRWTARIAFALARIDRRAAGSARSRAALLASNRSRNDRDSSSRNTRSGPSAGPARPPDDDVHTVALADQPQAVHMMPGEGSPAF